MYWILQRHFFEPGYLLGIKYPAARFLLGFLKFWPKWLATVLARTACVIGFLFLCTSDCFLMNPWKFVSKSNSFRLTISLGTYLWFTGYLYLFSGSVCLNGDTYKDISAFGLPTLLVLLFHMLFTSQYVYTNRGSSFATSLPIPAHSSHH
jgi:hypothetical protein